MTKARVFTLLSLAALSGSLAFAGCSSSNDSGSGGKSGSGGTGGSTGGTGGHTGGTGGSTGGTGGSTGGTGGGDGGCLPAPDPTTANACDTCQDDQHGGCACATQYNDCSNDADCAAILDCTVNGTDAGVGPCTTLDAPGAACTLQCVAGNPAGKTKYLAWEKCLYCQFCGTACDSTEYCTALDNPADGGTDSGTDSGSDATTDSATDGATEAASDSSAD